MSAVERQTVALDASNRLAEGDSVQSVTWTMTRETDGKAVTLSHEPTTDGNVISATFDGPADGLVAGVQYLFRVVFTAYPSTNVDALDLVVIVSS
jgi:hypothetical protein